MKEKSLKCLNKTQENKWIKEKLPQSLWESLNLCIHPMKTLLENHAQDQGEKATLEVNHPNIIGVRSNFTEIITSTVKGIIGKIVIQEKILIHQARLDLIIENERKIIQEGE